MNKINNIDINLDIDYDKLERSKLFKNINSAMDYTADNKVCVKRVSVNNLPPIHSKKELPIIYLIIRRLKDLSLLKRIVRHIPDITTFRDFVLWYREYQSELSLKDVRDIMSTSDDEELKTLYDVMYRSPDNRKHLHDTLYDNMFISLDVQHYLETTELQYEIYEGDKIKLHMYYEIGEKTKYIDRIMTIVTMMRYLAQNYHGTNNKLDLTIILSDRKKELPHAIDDELPLCADNINSGSCYPGSSVVIWRKEELIKVLIHELIHFHNFDFSYLHSGYDILYKTINSKLRLDGIDRCNESFTESLAIIINIHVHSRALGMSFRHMYVNEMKFLTLQVNKIVKYFGGSNINDIFNVTYNQLTSVRSYFIIKLLILLNIEKFVEFIDEYGCRLDSLIDKYAEFINKVLKSPLPYRDNLFDIFESIDLHSKENVYRNMRMSLIDM
jgi:hypothetical protein